MWVPSMVVEPALDDVSPLHVVIGLVEKYSLNVTVPNVALDGVAGAVSNVTVSWTEVPGVTSVGLTDTAVCNAGCLGLIWMHSSGPSCEITVAGERGR